MVDDVIEELRNNQNKAIEAFKRDLSRVRTGRANLAILEPVRVQYYGSRAPLNQVASLSIPEARLIVIKPWEKSMLPEIEKAINTAEIGLTPQSDGEVVRLPIPALTEERRKELTRQCRKMAEAAKVSIRNHRREANDMLKELEKDKEISEDDKKRGLERTQKETDKAVASIDEILEKKEKEILEI
ncbi:MAG: ribosome recycling factor [Deltaproteobacteria bacterium]|nr:MAG: ribosome recycling factor [Deltaproteobacteria bacterium]